MVRVICERVDDTLAVGPKYASRQLLQDLAKDMEIRRSLVTERPQEFLGRFLSKTTKGYLFCVAGEYVKHLYTDFGFGDLNAANNLAF